MVISFTRSHNRLFEKCPDYSLRRLTARARLGVTSSRALVILLDKADKILLFICNSEKDPAIFFCENLAGRFCIIRELLML